MEQGRRPAEFFLIDQVYGAPPASLTDHRLKLSKDEFERAANTRAASKAYHWLRHFRICAISFS